MAPNLVRNPPNLVRIPKVASILGIPVPRAYELARTGMLPGVVRIGRQIRVNPEKLQEFIDSGGVPLATEK